MPTYQQHTTDSIIKHRCSTVLGSYDTTIITSINLDDLNENISISKFLISELLVVRESLLKYRGTYPPGYYNY